MGSTVLLALVVGALWGCDGERVMQPQVEPRPLGKVAADGSAVVVVTVQQDGTPVSGVVVELSRSIAGVAASYDWSATTDENGQARIEVTSSGYYQARVVQNGSEVGYQSSIPLNVGTEVPLNLTIAGMVPADDPRALTQAYAEAGIVHYERYGLEATVAYYNSPESVDGQWFLNMVDADSTLLTSPLFPNQIGQIVEFPDPTVGTEEGEWFKSRAYNPLAPEKDLLYVWAIRHDGLLFLAGYFTSE